MFSGTKNEFLCFRLNDSKKINYFDENGFSCYEEQHLKHFYYWNCTSKAISLGIIYVWTIRIPCNKMDTLYISHSIFWRKYPSLIFRSLFLAIDQNEDVDALSETMKFYKNIFSFRKSISWVSKCGNQPLESRFLFINSQKFKKGIWLI